VSIIAIDYDGTVTADPGLWLPFIHDARSRGHTVICVTKRYAEMAADIRAALDCEIVHAVDSKRTAAQDAGYDVDIWIDDKPETITPLGALRRRGW